MIEAPSPSSPPVALRVMESPSAVLLHVDGPDNTSLVLDLLWPSAAGPGLAQSAVMVAVALLSVVVATVPWRRVPRRRRGRA